MKIPPDQFRYFSPRDYEMKEESRKRWERLRQRILRIRCWFRYYHRNTPEIGRFRYDCPGMCCDCGKVGDGVQPEE